MTCAVIAALAIPMASPASAHVARRTVAPTARAPGLLQIAGAAFPTSRHWLVMIDQCNPCGARSGTHTSWAAWTDDGGRTWRVRSIAVPLEAGSVRGDVSLEGARGWTTNGWYTRDGGRTWQRARVPGTVAGLSVAGGAVWAVDTTSASTRILAGTLRSARLRPSHAQPFAHQFAPGAAVTRSASTAFVQVEGSNGAVIERTTNGGRAWERLRRPCGTAADPVRAEPSGTLVAYSAAALVVTCVQKLGPPRGYRTWLATSVDAGRDWRRVPAPRVDAVGVEPVARTVAWAMGPGGRVVRTATRGRSWRVVWPPRRATGAAAGMISTIAASSPSRAFVTFVVSTPRGSYVVVRRTTDAGQHWSEVAAFSVP